MTVTTLDPKSALIVIDLQKGIVSLPTVHPIDDVVKHVGKLTEAFRRHGLPVVLVNVAGGAPGRTEQPRRQQEFPADWTDLIPELNLQPQDHVVTKHTPGAFTNTDLAAYLEFVGGHAGRCRRRRHQQWRRGHRAPGLRARLQRHPRDRRHDRLARRRPRLQRHTNVSEDRGDRHDKRDHRSSGSESLTMDWLHDTAYLLGGAFLANAVPHFVSGMMGRQHSESVRQAARQRSFRPRP